jgi:hypothetical protein
MGRGTHAEGDNFVTRGPWNILEGQAWLDWQVDSIEGAIAAARAVGDRISEARLTTEAAALRRKGPERPDLVPLVFEAPESSAS